jgi:hypothetical protein
MLKILQKCRKSQKYGKVSQKHKYSGQCLFWTLWVFCTLCIMHHNTFLGVEHDVFTEILCIHIIKYCLYTNMSVGQGTVIYGPL